MRGIWTTGDGTTTIGIRSFFFFAICRKSKSPDRLKSTSFRGTGLCGVSSSELELELLELLELELEDDELDELEELEELDELGVLRRRASLRFSASFRFRDF